MNQPPLKVKS